MNFNLPDESTISCIWLPPSSACNGDALVSCTISCWQTFSWFLILGFLPWTFLQELGITDLGLEAEKGPKPLRLPKEARTKYLSASSRPSMIHSKCWPSWLEQWTSESPWMTLKESNLLHCTRNFVKRLRGPTISGWKSLTLIFRGPVTSQMTLEGAWGRPEASRPLFNFLRPFKRFCHKFRCFSHSFKWAGVNWLPTMVVDLMSWPNFSTWSLLWLMRVERCWTIWSGFWKRLPSIARPTFSSEKSEKWTKNDLMNWFWMGQEFEKKLVFYRHTFYLCFWQKLWCWPNLLWSLRN